MHEYADNFLGGTDTVAKEAIVGSRDGKLFDVPSFVNCARANEK